MAIISPASPKVTIPAAPSIIHAILDAFHAWRGTREKPTVCILDWAEVPTRSEFVLYEREFAALGIDAFIGDPRDAEFKDGRYSVGAVLARGGMSVVYRGVDTRLDRPVALHPYTLVSARDAQHAKLVRTPKTVLHREMGVNVKDMQILEH